MHAVNCLRRAIVLLLLSFACLQSMRAQAVSAAEAGLASGARADQLDGLIKLDVVVTGSSGKPLDGLGVGDFTLLEDGKPNSIVSFYAVDQDSAKREAPVEVAILIDTVNLSGKQASYGEREVETFLRQNGGRLAQPVSLFWLSYSGLWSLPRPQPSRDGNVLAASLEHKGELRAIWHEPSYGGAATSSAFNLPLRALSFVAANERQKPGRKLLIWIGPPVRTGGGGMQEHQQSFEHVVWFSSLLREARVTLFAFSPSDAELHPLNYVDPPSRGGSGPGAIADQQFREGMRSSRLATPAYLERSVLAVQSGGRVLDSQRELASQIARCAEEANQFYTLTFNPRRAGHVDEYHDLRVVVSKPGNTAYTSTGFYSQPYYVDQPRPATKRITVEQLGIMLRDSQGEPDAELGKQLSGVELTERLSGGQLIAWVAALHGTKARQALVALADASAFLSPPEAEIATNVPPDPSAQRQMLSRTVEYLTKTIPKLPNFLATRTTVSYKETPAQYDDAGQGGADYQRLQAASTARATVLVRDGREVVEAEGGKRKALKSADTSLMTQGTFGPILGMVVLDASTAPSKMSWSRWEQGTGEPRAVFRYTVPAAHSHYVVSNCCLPDGDGTSVFRRQAGYHGEITLDPSTGAILRLTMEADLNPGAPMVLSNIMVEYGPVEIGRNTYICPVRSVAISRSRTVRVMEGWNESLRTFGPLVTALNDVAFGEYHIFRAEARIVPGPDELP